MVSIIQGLCRILGALIIFLVIFQISEYGELFLKNQFSIDISNKNIRNLISLDDTIAGQAGADVSREENDRPLFSIIDVPAFFFIFFLLLGFILLSIEMNYFIFILKRGLFISPYSIERNTELLVNNLKKLSDEYYSKGASSIRNSSSLKKTLPVWPLLVEQIELKIPFEDIQQILGNDAALVRKSFDRLIKIVNNISNIAPSLGVIGTVLGLIKLLFNLQDPSNLGPSMALALMTTFYGLFFSVIVFKPLVMRLESNKVAIMNSYQHANFWMNIIRSKKPSFYLEQKYS